MLVVVEDLEAQSPGARSCATRIEVVRCAFPRGDDKDLNVTSTCVLHNTDREGGRQT